jgi:hypothetical protein
MKLPPDSIIATEKLTSYLLEFREKSDKSKLMSLGGYTLDNWEELENDLRLLLENEEAVFSRTDNFGDYYTVFGNLRNLHVKTIWLIEKGTELPRFITLIPHLAKI